jgi:hypothetical protein
MNISDDSDVPFEAEMIEEVLTNFNAKQAWLFLLQVDGNSVFHVTAPIVAVELALPATAENLCAVLNRAEQQRLTLCGASCVDGGDRLHSMVQKTIDERHRTYIHRRIRKCTRDILLKNGATVAMLEDDSGPLTGGNPGRMN